MNRKKVLLISYLFPPVGGAGVQRNLKYVKYLPQFGWDPVVLSVKHIQYYVYDEYLLREVPQNVPIIRTGSLDPLRLAAILRGIRVRNGQRPGSAMPSYLSEAAPAIRVYRLMRNYLAFPDAQIGWIPFAYRRGYEAIRKYDVRAILASVGPVSSAIVARLLAARTGVPYALDFRDAWTDDPYFVAPTALHRWGHALLEKLVVGQADAVTVYDECLGRTLQSRYESLKDRVGVLPNGFDPADRDLIGPPPGPADIKRRIVYTGSLYAHHDENVRTLLAALNYLPEGIRSTLRILFVGQTYAGFQERIAAAGLSGDQIVSTGYVSHSEALTLLASADAALLFVRSGDVSSVTGKVFEYLMVGCPILACIEPEGACAKVLGSVGQGHWIAPPSDARAIARVITELAASNWQRSDSSQVERFSRKRTAADLAAILDQLSNADRKDRTRFI